MLKRGDKVYITDTLKFGVVVMCWTKDQDGVVLVQLEEGGNPVWSLLRHTSLIK